MKRLFVYIIKIYRKYISPLSPGKCRFVPTCSEYSLQAIEKYGALKGGFISIKRILRCNPFGKFGYDPVPEPKDMEGLKFLKIRR